ncbi:DUF2399 domain-containing protein [Acidovorax sp. SUPP950]|uniref:hypothetical protein n=1 Tax=Acidovorax sp. SUPP950 TaxID=511901 RepID=UPI0023CE47A9|nr:hypothetical protein [Acidovorax sp. SUPP950]GKS76372.1 DUF2399 domain-containing protein [Acidovorax sp. SUPP950]
MTALQTIPTGRNRQTRQASGPFVGLPELRPAQRDLLRRWLASDAAERQWQSLLERAGREQLDLADELRELLLSVGALKVKERFTRGLWHPERVVWFDVSALQQAVGLRNAADRAASRDGVLASLHALERVCSWSASAVNSCLKGSLPMATLQARYGLLQALAQWKAEQRFGTHRDFALRARDHTKGIAVSEWAWMAEHLALESFGIVRFSPLLWLGGALSLQTQQGRIDVSAAGFCGVPTAAFNAGTTAQGPRRYWLIENRASFERQAIQPEAGTCVVWLPGQPPTGWLTAMGWLLDNAPAPAAISCDPDPAGIAIAMSAGALWSKRGLAWTPDRMAPEDWAQAATSPLNDFDRALLARLQLQADLPASLVRLREVLGTGGRKAEQEGWV